MMLDNQYHISRSNLITTLFICSSHRLLVHLVVLVVDPYNKITCNNMQTTTIKLLSHLNNGSPNKWNCLNRIQLVKACTNPCKEAHIYQHFHFPDIILCQYITVDTHEHARTVVRAHIQTRTITHNYIYTHTVTHTLPYTNTHTRMHVHTTVNIHICTHTHKCEHVCTDA